MSLVHQRFMFERAIRPTPIDDEGLALEEPPPRHSADDYRAIAERLKQLGYRGWITG